MAGSGEGEAGLGDGDGVLGALVHAYDRGFNAGLGVFGIASDDAARRRAAGAADWYRCWGCGGPGLISDVNGYGKGDAVVFGTEGLCEAVRLAALARSAARLSRAAIIRSLYSLRRLKITVAFAKSSGNLSG